MTVPMHVSPSGISKIFCLSMSDMSELWLALVWQSVLNIWLAPTLENTKFPTHCRHTYSFWIISWDSDFQQSNFLLSSFSTPLSIDSKIPVHPSGAQSTLKMMICLSLLQALFFLVVPVLHEFKHKKLSWSSPYLWQPEFSSGNFFVGKECTNLNFSRRPRSV